MSRPRVLIADDHVLIGEGLRTVLESRFELLPIATDGQAALEAAESDKPDLILLDISLPKLNGLEVVERLRASGSAAKVVMLTMHCEPMYAAKALDNGAAAFVLKHSPITELLAAMDAALSGETYIDAEIRPNVTALLAAGVEEFDLEQRLTPRQRQVLQLYAEGCSAKEVAKNLSISKRTAENHKASIKQLLGVSSTAELVKLALRFGLVNSD